jgi:CRISPR/Cas system-associated exonuclease Cas4 (RecB family)
MIFDTGKWVENAVFEDLREAGFTIVEQQRAFSWQKYLITGSIDCKLALGGNGDISEGVYPTEIKSAAPHPFASINSIEDMLHHKYHYMRKYPAQLTLYLLMDGASEGLFLFKNKSTGEVKEIWMQLDFDFAEALVKKAEAINKHVADETLPEPMAYNEDICRGCGFEHICLPDRIGTEVDISDSTELLELVSRYATLKPGAKEYDEVNDRINKLVEGKEKLLVGDYFIEGKYIERTSYQVPPEIKAPYKVTSQSWRKNIIPV